MSVTYTAALPVRDQAVLFLSTLLHDERRRPGTRTGSRALSPFKHAVLILRWFLDGTRVAGDNAIGKFGHCGPPRCGQGENMTPPHCARTPTSFPR